jgi:V/A-type H+-transporting ATPase subunit A
MSRARIHWISGPVLRARAQPDAGPFGMREAVRVGPQALLGEVVRLQGDEVAVQVYEDTTGLRPGMALEGDGLPLAIRLGPGLLGHIFDGLLRPLAGNDSAFVAAGMRAAATTRTFRFTPRVRLGQVLFGGQVFGSAEAVPASEPANVLADGSTTGSADGPGHVRGYGSADGPMYAPADGPANAPANRPAGNRAQPCLVPPDIAGEVIEIAAAGVYTDTELICTLRRADGHEQRIAMSHAWPVRTPRPVRARLPARAPLVTGQRVLDSLFPVALGGKAAIPGGFGTGKTVLLEALAKGARADVIVYLGCGERGNEMAGVLEEFPQLTDPRSGQPLMQRTVVIANTSNMPVAAREASIYAAVTVAEYFRDQGLDVALMADSTSRWAEALREVSGRFGELPGEGGYPAYLASRLADFYERAAVVETLGAGRGSVTLIGAISPPSGDLSEPVTSHTKRYVRAFWTLDTKRAQARFYPAVHPLQSYAEDARGFAPWWAGEGNGDWLALRQRFLTLLDEQARLERMARIIGKDALPLRQQLTLACAELINDAFLRQSAFSEVDRVCSPARQGAMMRLVAKFIDHAETAVAAGVHPQQLATLASLRALQRMGEEIGDQQLERFAELEAALDREFALLAPAPGGDTSPGAATPATTAAETSDAAQR